MIVAHTFHAEHATLRTFTDLLCSTLREREKGRLIAHRGLRTVTEQLILVAHFVASAVPPLIFASCFVLAPS